MLALLRFRMLRPASVKATLARTLLALPMSALAQQVAARDYLLVSAQWKVWLALAPLKLTTAT